MPLPPEAPRGRDPVLAADLDGTVVGVNTFPLFVVFAIGRLLRQGEVAASLRLTAELARRKVLGTSHLRLKEAVHDAAVLVRDEPVLAWAERLLAREGNPEVVALVRGWEGTTVLCTAAPQPYAEAFGVLLGMDSVQGSTRTGGTFVENVSTQKAARVAEGHPGGVDCAITDDEVIDAPLLRLAARRLLVDAAGGITELAG